MRLPFAGLAPGYRLKPNEAYPAVLQERLQRDGYRHRVVNAGVNGDTAADARRRLGAALRPGASIVIVALGLNDVKTTPQRPVAQIGADLEAIIIEAQRRKVTVLLCGFKVPFQFNPTYEREFAEMYPTLATKYHVALVPDLMRIVWNSPNMTLDDDLHPNPTGTRFIARQVYASLKPLLSPAPVPNTTGNGR
jgi:acyl-CoA thioesterase I